MKKILNNFCLIIIGLLILSSCSKATSYESADAMIDNLKVDLKSITVDDLKLKMDDLDAYIFLIDVREPAEHNFGYIPSSINIPTGLVIFNTGNDAFWDSEMTYKPELTDEIIVYCKKGKRSVLAANLLTQIGYTNVTYVEGGWKAWELTFPLLYDKNLDAAAHPEVADEGGC
jgi:rhodanese-related sulfurtransferase